MKLEDIRREIDTIDNEITDLFAARMGKAAEIAECKKEGNLGVVNKMREREILSRVSERSGEEIEGYTRVLFNTLFDLSRSYQTRLLTDTSKFYASVENALENTPKLFPEKGFVACQGVEGAYSQMACDKLFKAPNILYFRHFDGVFAAVEKGLCQYGILPIENSSYGSVGQVYDLMSKHNFHIVRSIKLHIHHALLAKRGTQKGDIKEIFSHEQAIGQCSEFLRSLGDVKITVCENTAAAAEKVAASDRTDVAAISSANCAELYGLSMLSEDIQNSDNNYTRFICISKEMQIYPGANKISLMLSTPHKPGALYSLIAKFATAGINITKLESRPIPGRDFEFVFYFDVEASLYSKDVLSVLADLDASPELFVFLGSYSEVV